MTEPGMDMAVTLGVDQHRFAEEVGIFLKLVALFFKTNTIRGKPFDCAQERPVEPLSFATTGLRQAQAERYFALILVK
jgi:hypothetical protein